MRYVGVDPATHTGFVALDLNGQVLRAKELTGSGVATPRKIRTLHDEIMRHLQPEDVVCIEGFAMDAQDTNKVASGNNWAARLATDRVVGSFISAEPSLLKKFVNVSEWTGVKGSKVRLKGPEVKKLVMAAVNQLWGYSTNNSNISDAFVLAKIAEAVHDVKDGQALDCYPQHQQEVIKTIIDPQSKKAKKNSKKPVKQGAGHSKPGLAQAMLF